MYENVGQSTTIYGDIQQSTKIFDDNLRKVGMVRQDGYGNLQGFGGYRLGPHTVTMGYANDASLGEPGVSLPLDLCAPPIFLCLILLFSNQDFFFYILIF